GSCQPHIVKKPESNKSLDILSINFLDSASKTNWTPRPRSHWTSHLQSTLHHPAPCPPHDFALQCLTERKLAREATMSPSSITLRLDTAEKEAIQAFAHTYGQTTSEFIRTVVNNYMEDQLDLTVWEEAMAEFKADPETLSAEELAA